ncbi:MAG: DNA polymerase III subunit beta [Pirellulales bacterium]|nr:DNA polymerase III subunit beta [Pirellulales bacterium]
MKITCSREKLLAAFQLASPVVPSRSPKPILQNVKLDVRGGKAELLATDLEVGIRVDVQGIEAAAEGSAILPIGRFGSILRESNDETLRLETDGTGTLVRGERFEFRLPAENPEEFPAVMAFNETKYHEVSARLLRELVRRTVFATDNESSRYALGGVLLEMLPGEIIAVGTDGRRLATMRGPAQAVNGHGSDETAPIIPQRAMSLVERSVQDGDAEVHLAVKPNGVLVRTPRVTIFSRLVEGRFPKWRDVFPDRNNRQKIDLIVGPLHAAIRQAAIVAADDSSGVDFTFGGGRLLLTAQAAETGQSRVELPIAYDGPEITITLNPKFFSDFLKVLDPEKSFVCDLKDAEAAVVCQVDDGYSYLLMPLSRDR